MRRDAKRRETLRRRKGGARRTEGAARSSADELLKRYSRDGATSNVLRHIKRRLNRYESLCGREADEYLDEVEAYAARWALVLYHEIRRLEAVVQFERLRGRRKETTPS